MNVAYQPLIVSSSLNGLDELNNHLKQTKLFAAPLVATTPLEAVRLVQEHRIDLVLFDAQQDDESLPLQLLSLFTEQLSVMVISSNEQDAVSCFDLNVRAFIPKPIQDERFMRGIARCMQLTPVTRPSVQPESTSEFVFLKVGRKTERFVVQHISYVKAYGIYTKVYTESGFMVVNERISDMEKLLPASGFQRIHKSTIINVSHVKRAESKAIWIGKQKFPIGVTYRTRVQTLFKDLRSK